MEKRQTEQRLTETAGIDTWDDARILITLVDGQDRAVASVRAAIPQIARAANLLAGRLAAGGRLIYAGAGTSIRIAVQDGSELPATFGMADDSLAYLIAGGRSAIFDSSADAEDDTEAALRDAAICTGKDTLIAVAASGSTPYTLAAARTAKARGCSVIVIANNAGSPLGAAGDVEIILDSGPEVIAGSTRMAAGTAQKAALNLLSTLAHIKLGAVHDGMMVNVQASNLKLRQRAADIVAKIAGVDQSRAAAALSGAGGEVKPAVLMCKAQCNAEQARKMLKATNGNLRQALSRLAGA